MNQMLDSKPIELSRSDAPPRPKRRSVRAIWVQQITLWHWVSSGVCLGGMLLFTVTGITLNHAAEISAEPVVTTRSAAVPPAILAALKAWEPDETGPLPESAVAWFAEQFDVQKRFDSAEWSPGEVYLSLPRPGGDAWIAVDLESGEAELESTDRGWVSYLNDLHKGRNTGPAWRVFIDVLAIACLIFTVSGLLLLQTRAAKRPATWPLVFLSFILPVALLMLFGHR
jgi:uncharacterized protein